MSEKPFTPEPGYIPEMIRDNDRIRSQIFEFATSKEHNPVRILVNIDYVPEVAKLYLAEIDRQIKDLRKAGANQNDDRIIHLEMLEEEIIETMTDEKKPD